MLKLRSFSLNGSCFSCQEIFTQTTIHFLIRCRRWVVETWIWCHRRIECALYNTIKVESTENWRKCVKILMRYTINHDIVHIKCEAARNSFALSTTQIYLFIITNEQMNVYCFSNGLFSRISSILFRFSFSWKLEIFQINGKRLLRAGMSMVLGLVSLYHLSLPLVFSILERIK